MLAIIKKDFHETFCITKNLVGIIFSLLVLLFLFIAGKSAYTFFLIVLLIFPLLGSAPLQYSMEQDDISKFDDILLTYPLTKREIILAKFLSCFLFTAACELITLALTMIYVYGYHVIDLKTGLMAWAASILFSLFMTSISNFGFYCLGTKKGNIFYILFVIVIALGYVMTYFNIDVFHILTWGPAVLFLLGTVITLASLALSYWGCLKVYTRKHS